MAKDKTAKDFNELAQSIKDGTLDVKDAEKAFQALNKSLKQTSIESAKAAAAQMRYAESWGDTIGQLDAARELVKEHAELNAQAFETQEGLTEQQREAIELRQEEIASMKDAVDAAKEYIEAIEALGPGYEEALRLSQPFFEDIATKMGLMSKRGNKLAQRIGEIIAAGKKNGGLKGLAEGFTKAFSAANIGMSIMTKVVEATLKQATAVDKAGAAYAKTTGFGREFDSMLSATNDKLKMFNVEAEDVQKGLVALRTGLSQFNTIGGETQQQLLDTVVGLEKLGVANDDAVATIANLNKAFGTSVTEAANVTRELALTGKAIGMTASQMTKQYTKSLGVLAVYGPKSVDIFTNIAAMAKNAQVEVGALMGIAEKFNDFSSSAQTAAKMNAILGTSFSGVNMMMMDHDKRIEEVIRGMQKTGVAFKNLDKFTQQAIATQLGIKDMAEANKILGQSLGGYRKMQAEAEATAKSQEEMEKRMKAAMSIVDQLKKIMMQFAIDVQPVIPFFKKLAEVIAGVLKFMKDFHPMTILVTGALMFFAGKGLIAAASIKILGKVAAGAAPGVAALGGSMGAVGLSMLGIGLSVALIVGSFALLFQVIFDGLATLASFGADMTGVGITLAGMGLSIYLVASAIGVLTAAFAALGTVGSIGGALFVAILLAMAAAAAAIHLIISTVANKSDIVSKMSESLKEVARMRNDIKNSFAAIGEGLSVSQKTLDDIESRTGAKISSVLANVALITTGKAAGEMSGGGAGEALSRGLGKLTDALGSFFGSNDKSENKKVTLKLDSAATKEFFNKGVAEAHSGG